MHIKILIFTDQRVQFHVTISFEEYECARALRHSVQDRSPKGPFYIIATNIYGGPWVHVHVGEISRAALMVQTMTTRPRCI